MPDAYPAALLKQNGVSRLYTAGRDFRPRPSRDPRPCGIVIRHERACPLPPRRVDGRRLPDGDLGHRALGAITPHEVAQIIKEAVRRSGSADGDSSAPSAGVRAADVSAHSTRVGAAQDLVAAGADLVSLMQSGGWKDSSMPARFVRRLGPLRGGMAKLYADSPVVMDKDAPSGLFVRSPAVQRFLLPRPKRG